MGNYIRNSIGIRERLIYEAKMSKIVFAPGIIIMSVGVLIITSGGASTLSSSFFYLILGALLLLGPAIKYNTTELGFTSKRLIGKNGLIDTHALDSPITKINDVSSSSGALGKICNYGNIYIATSSGRYFYKRIANPEKFKQLLFDQIDRYEEDRMQSQADKIAAAMKNTY